MSTEREEQSEAMSSILSSSVRVVQIITFALVQSSFLFAVIVLFAKQGQMNSPAGPLTWIAAGVSGVLFVLQLIVPGVIARSGLAKLSTAELKGLSEVDQFRKLMPIFQSQHIVGCAMLEGAALLGAICYMMEENWIAMAVCAAMTGSLVAKFPTATSVRFWVENKIREIQLR